jgi:hypothetical protein
MDLVAIILAMSALALAAVIDRRKARAWDRHCAEAQSAANGDLPPVG